MPLLCTALFIIISLAQKYQSDTFDETVKKITDHLKPKQNIIFNRYTFRSMVQAEDKSLKGYVTRLKDVAEKCEFVKYSTVQSIIEQVVVN